MFVVYLKDGRRVDIPEATAVAHRTVIVFLDQQGNVVEQFATSDIIAYSRTTYVDDALGMNASEEGGDKEGDLIMLRRHRRRRKVSPRRDQAYDGGSLAVQRDLELPEQSLG